MTARDELAKAIKEAHSDWLRNSKLDMQEHVANSLLRLGYRLVEEARQ